VIDPFTNLRVQSHEAKVSVSVVKHKENDPELQDLIKLTQTVNKAIGEHPRSDFLDS